MAVIAGGWTTDTGYVAYLDESGLATTIFRAMVKQAIKAKLTLIESTGNLDSKEKLLMDSGEYGIDRVIDFFRLETKYLTRGLYMPYADIQYCLNAQWENIKKRWA